MENRMKKDLAASRDELGALRAYRSRLVYFAVPNAKSDDERETIGKDIRMAHTRIRQLEEQLSSPPKAANPVTRDDKGGLNG